MVGLKNLIDYYIVRIKYFSEYHLAEDFPEEDYKCLHIQPDFLPEAKSSPVE